MQRIAKGDFLGVLERLGAKWVGFVQETFSAEGPGWAPLKLRTILNRRLVWTGLKNTKGQNIMRRSHKILVVTGLLKRSIHYEVEL